MQQRLLTPQSLEQAWRETGRSRRRALIEKIIRDVCDGAQSLGELDFARLCREVGLPEPSRQVVRQGYGGRAYLDVAWDDVGLVIEIDGGHHQLALNPIDDALRQNEETLRGSKVLRVPVIGLRVAAERFMAQVSQGFWMLWRAQHGQPLSVDAVR